MRHVFVACVAVALFAFEASAARRLQVFREVFGTLGPVPNQLTIDTYDSKSE
jgi:hypothetical protein